MENGLVGKWLNL